MWDGQGNISCFTVQRNIQKPVSVVFLMRNISLYRAKNIFEVQYFLVECTIIFGFQSKGYNIGDSC